MPKRTLERFTGCLLGGAVGDALGYAVEFGSWDAIRRKYGQGGIRCYELVGGKALISDDTQMTMFTANGILVAETLSKRTGTAQPPVVSIWRAYLDWLATQDYSTETNHISWLYNVSSLHSARSPGNTCLQALSSGQMGTVEQPINHSKGCGGVMRVAPIGLFYGGSGMTLQQICDLGASAAAITHGHPLGYMSAEGLVFIIQAIINGAHDEGWLGGGLRDVIYDCRDYFMLRYPQDKHALQLVELLNKAIYLAGQSVEPTAAIAQLGEGWVGEEALAIAVYCSLKFSHSFGDAVIAAVNHSGDSDSTGAITGNILGAYLGIDAIEKRFLEPLELRSTIEELARDLYKGCPDKENTEWDKKYYKL